MTEKFREGQSRPQTDTETDRQAEKDTDRERDGQTDTETDRERDGQTDTETGTHRETDEQRQTLANLPCAKHEWSSRTDTRSRGVPAQRTEDRDLKQPGQ